MTRNAEKLFAPEPPRRRIIDRRFTIGFAASLIAMGAIVVAFSLDR